MKKEIIHKLAEIDIPDSRPAEDTVIADVLYNPDMCGDVMEIVNKNMFTDDNTRRLWDFIEESYSAGESFEMAAAMNVTDREYFIKHIMSVPMTSMFVIKHAHDLREAYTRRLLYFAGLEICQKSGDRGQNIDDLTAVLTKHTDNLSQTESGRNTKSLAEVLSSLAETLEAPDSIHVSTGFYFLDYMTLGGLRDKWMVILAARPGVGKTAVALHMMKHAAMNGTPCVFFSLEMTAEELAQRLILSTGKVSSTEIANRQLDWNRYNQAETQIAGLPIYIDDKSRSLVKIKAAARALKAKGKCGAIFIDYLALIEKTDNSQSIYDHITQVSKELKVLAKELCIPIIVLAQLNRQSVSNARHPETHDLRDSGAIEQDADLIMMLDDNMDLDQDDRDEPKQEGDCKRVNLFVRKFRHGKGKCKVKLISNESYTQFEEYNPGFVQPMNPIVKPQIHDEYADSGF